MERENKKIKLLGCEVSIITFLTWGEKEGGSLENIGAGMANLGNEGLKGLNGNPLLEAKYKRLEIAIKEIRQGDKIINFSRDWMNELKEEDGEKLYEEVEKLFSKKK